MLGEYQSGKKVMDICREHGISDATFYNWKNKYNGMQLSELKRLRELESENSKLKRIVAELNLENYALKDLIEKSCNACQAQKLCRISGQRTPIQLPQGMQNGGISRTVYSYAAKPSQDEAVIKELERLAGTKG